ncbi:polyprenyl synthetase family protein [bacterium]|nr:polyprenyl synthetase family protein [bacterium]
MDPLHYEFDDIFRPVRPFLNAFQIAFQKEFESIKAAYNLDFDTRHLNKGKHLRPILFFLCQGLIDEPNENSVDIAVMLELVHTASLIHDDVIDKSHRRRGQKTLNAVLGNHFSVLVGDFLIARMMLMSSSREKGEMAPLFEAIIQMTHSEIHQAICEKEARMEEETYFNIIQGKTGALFQAAGVLAGCVVHASKNQIQQLGYFGSQFGLAFQIKDDMLDFTGSVSQMGKPVHQDLRSGRWTLPLIQAFDELSEKDREHYRQHMMADDISQKKLVKMVDEHEGIKKSQSYLEAYSDQARQALLEFPASKYRSTLEQMIDYNRDRYS